MSQTLSLARPHAALVALGGPVVAGAILGSPVGLRGTLGGALMLPLILAGLTLIMVPALYIGASIVGVAPPARSVARAAWRALRAASLVLLGVAAPAAFLLATTHTGRSIADEPGASLLALLVVGGGALAGLRVVYADLFAERPERARVLFLFGAWSLVSLAIGMRLLVTTFHL